MPRHVRSLAVIASVALAAAALSGGTQATAASDDGAFSPLSGVRPAGPDVRVDPVDFTAFRVDTGEVRSDLAGTPAAGAATGAIIGT